MPVRKKNQNTEKKKKILGILIIFLAALFLISIISHSEWDDHRIEAYDNPFGISFSNQVGIIGAFTSYVLMFFFGWLAVLLPFAVAYIGFFYLDSEWRRKFAPALLSGLAVCSLATILSNIHLVANSSHAAGYADSNGGYILYYFAFFLARILGSVGSYLLLSAGIIICLVYFGYSYEIVSKRMHLPFKIDISSIWFNIRSAIVGIFGKVLSVFRRRKETGQEISKTPSDFAPETEELPLDMDYGPQAKTATSAEPDKPSLRTKRKMEVKKKPATAGDTSIGKSTQDFNFPSLELLDDNPESGTAVNSEELEFTSRALKETLETFDISIDGRIDKLPGPVITRYEFKPAAGVKVNRIINLSDDLALALKAKRIRIVAPIPGKAAVGVEIPNRKPSPVYLKEIIGSSAFSDSRIRLPLSLGKTISGKPMLADLSKMPHLLIAGATGSGKSVCINCLITSLIYRLHPRDIKFIFIDPKMLELSVYAGIPHLGRPVVTNAKRAEKVLADAVAEMENRYKKLAKLSVRNIEDYNARMDNNDDKMPYIVIIVDELADMMMAASSSRIEMLITRLAQMARAVGIHLILATQRPSVDVITGLIKANFSARIGFQVATKIDSRTILDCNGAEKLLGNGDMLFLPPGQPEPVRLHGAFISSQETEQLVKFILDQFPSMAAETGDKDKEEDDSAEDALDLDDPLFIEAAQTVIRHKQGSVSLLQRKLGIGYQRAARLIDRLEDAKIVSAYDGSKAREVLVDKSYIDDLLASRSLTNRNQ
jgi:S-DNA-T family DNA segregation ATPase FtsK/SpoIIIE